MKGKKEDPEIAITHPFNTFSCTWAYFDGPRCTAHARKLNGNVHTAAYLVMCAADKGLGRNSKWTACRNTPTENSPIIVEVITKIPPMLISAEF